MCTMCRRKFSAVVRALGVLREGNKGRMAEQIISEGVIMDELESHILRGEKGTTLAEPF